MIPTTEIGLRAVGTALAALSTGFAVYMLANGEHKPRVFGLEYLAIFAQPRGMVHAPPPEAPLALRSVDMGPTGSIASVPTPPPPRPPRLVAAEPGRAWLMIGGAIRSAAPGDDVEGVGRVAKIVERDGEWALLDEKGATLLALKNKANGAAMFSRRMIFR